MVKKFPVFLGQFSPNFYQKEKINQTVTFKMHAKASKMLRGSFWIGGVWSSTVFQLEATLRPPVSIFDGRPIFFFFRG
jgi:hypothetical protein